MRTSKLITSATTLPVTLTEIKTHLGIYHTEKDSIITGIMEAAVFMAERFTGQIFHQGGQTYEQSVRSFGEAIELDYSPATGIESVKYFDASDTEQTLATGSYQLVDFITPQFVEFGTTPAVYDRPDAVKIRYTVGFLAVPADVKTAIILITQNLYDNPGDSVRQMPTTSEYILRNHKVK